MRLLALLFAVTPALAGLGCGAIDTLDDPDGLPVESSSLHERLDAIGPTMRATLAAPIPGDRAFVRDDADLFGAVDRVGQLGLPGEDGVGGLVHVAVVAVDATTGRVQVERVEDRAAPCWAEDAPTASLGFDVGYRWLAWVDADALAPVVRDPVSLGFDDGTSITVASGVVSASGEAWGAREWAVTRGEGRPFVDLALPAAHLGQSYAARESVETDGHVAQVDTPTLDGRPWPGVIGSGRVSGATPSDDPGFVHVGDGCIDVHLRVESLSWNVPAMCGGGRGFGYGSLREWVIQPDVEATWPDGSAAGVTRRRVVHHNEPFESDGRLCFDTLVFAGFDAAGQVTVCHRIEDVTGPSWPNHSRIELPPILVDEVDAPDTAVDDEPLAP